MARRRSIALTRLEAEIMRAVWDAAPEPVRVRDIVDAVNADRPEPLAYNTVQTMLTILKDKGIVETVRPRRGRAPQSEDAPPGARRAHYFRAKVSRDAASGHMLRDLADRLFGGRVEPLLSRLIDEADLDPAELQRLRDFIDARLRDGGGDSA